MRAASSIRKAARRQKEDKMQKFKKWISLYIMMLPGLLYLFMNNYIPMLGIVIAFKKMNFTKGILGSEWCGFDNFKYLFSTQDAFVITRNTLLYNVVFILLNTFLAIFFAILICGLVNKTAKKFFQSTILFPFLMSIVIVSYMVYAFLAPESGMINNTILKALGKSGISWYSEPKYWPFILCFVNAWKGVGYGCLIYISAINGIDPSYFEAASIDGASKWKQIKLIMLPELVPTIITMTILSVGKIFYSDFGLFYQVPMNSGALYSTTNVIDTYVYRGLLQLGNVGMSSAAGLYQSAVGFILVLATNYIVGKISKENALF